MSCYFTELLLYWAVTLLNCYFTVLLLYWADTLLNCNFTELLLYWAVTLLSCYSTEHFLYWAVTLLSCYFAEFFSFLNLRNSEVSQLNFLCQIYTDSDYICNYSTERRKQKSQKILTPTCHAITSHSSMLPALVSWENYREKGDERNVCCNFWWCLCWFNFYVSPYYLPIYSVRFILSFCLPSSLLIQRTMK